MDPESFIREKLQEIEERGRTLSTPQIQWFRSHASEYNVYVSRAFQRELSPEESTGRNSFLDRLKRRYNPEAREGFAGDRGLRENLLSESNGRCKSCGTRLDYDSIRIDHVMPLAEGGSNLRGNLQALCEPCNQGKADYLDCTAIAAARPWFETRSDLVQGNVELTAVKRYCVLLRGDRRCLICRRSWKESCLHVVQRVPEYAGGQPIFDNLMIRCSNC